MPTRPPHFHNPSPPLPPSYHNKNKKNYMVAYSVSRSTRTLTPLAETIVMPDLSFSLKPGSC